MNATTTTNSRPRLEVQGERYIRATNRITGETFRFLDIESNIQQFHLSFGVREWDLRRVTVKRKLT